MPSMTEQAAMQRSLARQALVRSLASEPAPAPEPPPKAKAAPVATDAPVADRPVARPKPKRPEPVTEPEPPAVRASVASPTPPVGAVAAPPVAFPTESPPITAASVKQDVSETASAGWDELKGLGAALLGAAHGVKSYLSDPVAAQQGMADAAQPPPQAESFEDWSRRFNAERDEIVRAHPEDPLVPETDPATGVEIVTPGSRKAAQQAINRGRDLPGSNENLQRVAERYKRPPNVAPVSAHEDLYKPGPLESVSHLLEPADFARRGLDNAVNWVGQFFPDPTPPGEQATATSDIGDYLQEWTGNLGVNVIESMAHDPVTATFESPITAWNVLTALPRTTYQTVTGKEPKDPDAHQMGRGLYQAWSDGTLYQKGQTERGYELGIPGIDLYRTEDGDINVEVPFEHEVGEEMKGWTTPYPKGIHMIDAAVPIALARKLAASADTPNERWFYGNLSTTVGRELMGVGIEFARDPLWLFGAAKGAQIVYLGDKAITIAAPLARAAKLAAQVGDAENSLGLKKMAEYVLERGTPGGDDAKKFFDHALEETRRRQATFDQKAAVAREAGDENALRIALRNGRVMQAQGEQIQRGLNLANRADSVKEAGRLAYHLPFSEQTRYATDGLPQPRALMPSWVLKVEEAALESDLLKPFTKEGAEELNRLTVEAMSKGDPSEIAGLEPWQVTAWFWHNYVPGGVGMMTKLGFQAVAKVLGTRYIQPVLARVASENAAAAFNMRLKLGSRTYEMLKRVPEETWLDYMAKVTKFAQTTKALETLIAQKTKAAFADAVRTYKRRKRTAADELVDANEAVAITSARIEEAKQAGGTRELAALWGTLTKQQNHVREVTRWNDHTYSAREVFAEMWDLHESGAGKRNPAYDLDQLDQLRYAIVRKHPQVQIDEVNHALAAIGRGWSQGNLAEAELLQNLSAAIDDIRRNGADDLANWRLEGLQLVTEAWLRRQGGMDALVEALGEEKLAKALEWVQANDKGSHVAAPIWASWDASRPRHPANVEAMGYERAIRAELLELLDGDADAVADVLSHAAIAMGKSSGTEALKVLADLVSMQGAAGAKAGRQLLAGLRELLSDWSKEVAALKAIARGEFNDENVLSALHHVLSGEVELKIARARGAVGREQWPDFLRWARAERPVELPIELETNVGAWEQALRAWTQAQTLAHAASKAAEKKTGALSERMAGIVGRSGGPFTRSRLIQTRFEQALKGATTHEEARNRIRKALDDLLDTNHPGEGYGSPLYRTSGGAVDRIADELAESLAREWMKGGAQKFGSGVRERIQAAIASAVGAEKREIHAETLDAKAVADIHLEELRERLAKVQPAFVVPDHPTPVLMKAWEAELQDGFQAITKGLEPEEKMKYAFAALRNGPDVPEFIEKQYAELDKRYGQVFGARFQDIPDDALPIVLQIRSIVASYEDLYVKHGFAFMKDPVARLRDWGVDAYAPHIAANKMLLMRGEQKAVRAQMQEHGTLASGVETLDKRLGIKIDAQEARKIRGTVREINLRATSSDVQFTFDPELIVTRYMQSNRAIGAKEFLVGLVESGVAKPYRDGPGTPASVLAQADDYVPLFQVAKGADGNENEFARMFEDIPEVAQGLAIEKLRTKLGMDSDGPRRLFEENRVVFGEDDARNWERVAEKMNPAGQPDASRVTGEYLRNYYESDAPVGSLYVPRAVLESMKDLYGMESAGLFKKSWVDLYRRFQNYWKTRLTVVSVAFSTRNAPSNHLSNMLDLGVFGANNPATQMWAARVAAAAEYAEDWGAGSLKKAYEALQTPVDKNIDGAVKTKINDAGRLASLASFKGQGLHHFLKGIELGDGMILDCDETLQLLRDRDIISPSFTQFVDIAAVERSLFEDGITGDWKRMLRNAASYTEDAFLLTGPMMMAGGVIVPVALPKTWGKILARRVENQARLVNFKGNMRRSSNLEESVAHVQKFLFNYADLNYVQRTWLRLLIPFFTWQSKNLQLHFDMIQRSPAFYNKFRQVFVSGGPRVLQARGETEPEDFEFNDPGDERMLAGMQDYARAQLRVEIPGQENLYYQGLGTPIESAADQIGMAVAFFNFEKWWPDFARGHDRQQQLRFLGSISFLAKFALEFALGRNFFYNKDLTEVRNAADMGEILKGVNNVPFIGPVLRQYLVDLWSIELVRVMQKGRGVYDEEWIGSPTALYLLHNNPLSRVLNDATALTETYHLDQAADTLGIRDVAGEAGAPLDEVSWYHRWIDAYGGPKIKQDNKELNERMLQRKIGRGVEQEQVTKGVLGERTQTYVR